MSTKQAVSRSLGAPDVAGRRRGIELLTKVAGQSTKFRASTWGERPSSGEVAMQ